MTRVALFMHAASPRLKQMHPFEFFIRSFLRPHFVHIFAYSFTKIQHEKINISPLKSSSFCIHSVCKTFTFELFNGLLFPCVSHHIVT